MKISARILITLFFVCEAICIAFAIRSFLYPIKYKNLITKYAQEYNLSPTVVASIINVESRFNKDAKSKAGAIGLMQITPNTAIYICQLNHIQFDEKNDLYNPEKNIKIGCMYFRYLLNKFQDFDNSIYAYNAGETTVNNWLKNTKYSQDKKHLKDVPYNETKNYLIKINKNIKIYKNYKF